MKSTDKGVLGAKPTYFFLERYMTAFIAEWGAFMEVVLENKTIPVTMDDGVIALAMAEAATTSLSKSTLIHLSEI